MWLFRTKKFVGGLSSVLLLAAAASGCGESTVFSQHAIAIDQNGQPEWLSPNHDTCGGGYSSQLLTESRDLHITAGSRFEEKYQEVKLDLTRGDDGSIARLTMAGIRPTGFVANYIGESGSVNVPYYFGQYAEVVSIEPPDIVEPRLQSVELCYPVP